MSPSWSSNRSEDAAASPARSTESRAESAHILPPSRSMPDPGESRGESLCGATAAADAAAASARVPSAAPLICLCPWRHAHHHHHARAVKQSTRSAEQPLLQCINEQRRGRPDPHLRPHRDTTRNSRSRLLEERFTAGLPEKGGSWKSLTDASYRSICIEYM